jgi:transposase-like protein
VRWYLAYPLSYRGEEKPYQALNFRCLPDLN